VAFTAGLTGGSALLTADGRSSPHVLSSLPNADRTYTFPQINNAGDVIVREQVPGGPPNSFIALYRAPDGTRNLVARNGGTYDSVLLPTLANDRGLAFVALTGGATQTGLYSNPTGQSGQEQ